MPAQRSSGIARVTVLVAGLTALVLVALVGGLAWYGTHRSDAPSGQAAPAASNSSSTSPGASTESGTDSGVGGDTGPNTGPNTDRKVADVGYATSSPAQRLDLYLPEQARTQAVPLVVDVHGGGWDAGDKTDVLELWNVDPMNAAGIAVASVNYRLSGEARFPAGVQDVKAAIRWLRANAATYHLDPDRIALSGSSAGGTIAALAGVTGALKTEFDGGGLGNDDESSAVLAVVDVYGVADMLTMDTQTRATGCDVETPLNDRPDSPEAKWLGFPIQTRKAETAKASPITYLATAGAATEVPPFYLLHGTSDCLVPPAQSRQFEQALKRAGVPVTVGLVDGAGHADPNVFLKGGAGAAAFLQRALLG